ncbi:MAG: hypothetical protein KAU14_09520, partial [Thermoplasmata archaeon]|nr:hypothetical protein [Thermoplasmata archaeon]
MLIPVVLSFFYLIIRWRGFAGKDVRREPAFPPSTLQYPPQQPTPKAAIPEYPEYKDFKDYREFPKYPYPAEIHPYYPPDDYGKSAGEGGLQDWYARAFPRWAAGISLGILGILNFINIYIVATPGVDREAFMCGQLILIPLTYLAIFWFFRVNNRSPGKVFRNPMNIWVALNYIILFLPIPLFMIMAKTTEIRETLFIFLFCIIICIPAFVLSATFQIWIRFCKQERKPVWTGRVITGAVIVVVTVLYLAIIFLQIHIPNIAGGEYLCFIFLIPVFSLFAGPFILLNRYGRILSCLGLGHHYYFGLEKNVILVLSI